MSELNTGRGRRSRSFYVWVSVGLLVTAGLVYYALSSPSSTPTPLRGPRGSLEAPVATTRDYLGPYRLIRTLNYGKFCEVWEAKKDGATDRVVVTEHTQAGSLDNLAVKHRHTETSHLSLGHVGVVPVRSSVAHAGYSSRRNAGMSSRSSCSPPSLSPSPTARLRCTVGLSSAW